MATQSLMSLALAEAPTKAPNNNPIGILAFLIVVGITAYLFFGRINPLIKLVRQGKPENRTDQLGRRVGFFFTGWIFQKKLFRSLIPGIIHALIFWSFLIVNTGVLASVLYGMLPIHLPLVSSRPVAVIVDLFMLMVFVTVAYFAIRRAFIKPKYLTNTKDGWIVLSLISTGIIFEILIEAFAWRATLLPEAGYAPVGRRLGDLFGTNPETSLTLWTVFWWLKILIVACFVVYLPTSKHFHVMTSIFNTFFQSTRPKGELRKIENIEEIEHYGANKIEDFTWKDLLDTTSCTECGRCTQVCPANQTGKPLNPKKIIVDMKLSLFNQSKIPLTGHTVTAGGYANNSVSIPPPGAEVVVGGGSAAAIEIDTAGAADSGGDSAQLPALVGGLITQDELWACTTCRACMTECPVFIEHVPKIIDMRRYLVLDESEFPPEVTPLFNNLERNGNPWTIRPDERLEWTSKMDFEVKVLGAMDEGEEVDVLFWVGCMGALDQRNKKVTQNLANILEEAGLNWAILGPEESCTGDPARRIGNEYLFQMLAQQNAETLNGYKASHKIKKVVTACPHCFNSLKNEYPQFDVNFEVVHHTQLIAKLMEEGKLKTGDGMDGTKVTYHDPCYLGRYNDIYDAPRYILNELGSGLKKMDFVEMPRNKSKSFCCGGGGGRMFMEEKIGTRVNQTRVQEAADTGAEVVAAGCPFCVSMFEDGIKGRGLEDKIKVMELTELIQVSRKPKAEIVTASESTSPTPEE